MFGTFECGIHTNLGMDLSGESAVNPTDSPIWKTIHLDHGQGTDSELICS